MKCLAAVIHSPLGRLSLPAMILTLSLSLSAAQADIYMWKDADGVTHFTNAPTSPEYQIYLKESPPEPSRPDASDPPDPDRYDAVIAAASEKHGIEAPLLKAVIKAESDFNPQAVSHKGALGLMQIMPFNLEELQIADPFDPWENIMGGAVYLKKLLERFSGQLDLALAAYNAGPERVEQYRRIPPFEETQEYVRRVMKYYRLLKNDPS